MPSLAADNRCWCTREIAQFAGWLRKNPGINWINYYLYQCIWLYMILYDFIWFYMILYDNDCLYKWGSFPNSVLSTRQSSEAQTASLSHWGTVRYTGSRAVLGPSNRSSTTTTFWVDHWDLKRNFVLAKFLWIWDLNTYLNSVMGARNPDFQKLFQENRMGGLTFKFPMFVKGRISLHKK